MEQHRHIIRFGICRDQVVGTIAVQIGHRHREGEAAYGEALPVLSAARVALFLVSGASKREALRRLLAHDDIPAAIVQTRKIVIIADEAAAP